MPVIVLGAAGTKKTPACPGGVKSSNTSVVCKMGCIGGGQSEDSISCTVMAGASGRIRRDVYLEKAPSLSGRSELQPRVPMPPNGIYQNQLLS